MKDSAFLKRSGDEGVFARKLALENQTPEQGGTGGA
jgi:hypothetical protein